MIKLHRLFTNMHELNPKVAGTIISCCHCTRTSSYSKAAKDGWKSTDSGKYFCPKGAWNEQNPAEQIPQAI